MPQRPPARLEILFARDAPRAVIFRRGPVRATLMTTWNTETDTFTHGQWVKHKIYAERSHLSPDGQNLIYFAFRYRGNDGHHLGGFSALCRPPYFTARAFFPQGDTWGGGGYFIDNQHVWLRGHFAHGPGADALPDGLKPVFFPRDLTDAPKPYATQMRAPETLVYADGTPAQIATADLDRIRSAAGNGAAVRAWTGGRVPPLPSWCVVRNGCLFRRLRTGEESLLKNFNPLQFERVRAPMPD